VKGEKFENDEPQSRKGLVSACRRKPRDVHPRIFLRGNCRISESGLRPVPCSVRGVSATQAGQNVNFNANWTMRGLELKLSIFPKSAVVISVTGLSRLA
jgi:hypothetical protein